MTTIARPCPICGAPAQEAFRPFCSRRCKTIDLNRWLDGAYRLPSEDTPEPGEQLDLPDSRPH